MTNEIIMASRIAEIIEYKTKGNKAEFARLMGWSKQYLHNLLTGATAAGIMPITTIAEKLPELNTRWLLTGEGNMIETTANILRTWFALEPYIPVMTADERARIDAGGGYTPEMVERWKTLTIERKLAIHHRFAAAYDKMNGEKCK